MTMRSLRTWLAGSIVLAACSAPAGESVERNALSGEGEIVRTRALRPRSGERIDCGGRTMRGAPVLLYLLDVEDVTVENCIFKDADFAIIAVRGGGHHFRANRFENMADTAIWVVGSSGNEVRNNVVQGGAGFMFNGNADHNRVHHNVIRGWLGVGAYWTPTEAVINVVVDGELTQVLNAVDMLDDLRVWKNDIELTEDGFVGIGLMGRTQDGHAWNNKVRDGFLGVASWGYEVELPIVLPGRCSRDTTRRCTPENLLEEGSDCFVPGIDRRSKGTCVGAKLLEGETRVIRSTFTGNVISGASGAGVEAYLAPSTRVEGNDISGCDAGLRIGDFMLESGTVVGNVVRGNRVGLAIDNMFGTRAGAQIAFNDFIGYVEPDHTQQRPPWCWDCPTTEYQLATDLSLNHWGLTCAQGGAPAFNDADLTASAAYGAPVAEAYRAAVEAGDAIDPTALGPLCDR